MDNPQWLCTKCLELVEEDTECPFCGEIIRGCDDNDTR